MITIQTDEKIMSQNIDYPKVTIQDIEANIIDEVYFNAGTTAKESNLHYKKNKHHPLDLLTICVLTLENGFTVTGESACASKENFDPEVGRKVARANAVNKIWPLMGYELKGLIHDAEQDTEQAYEQDLQDVETMMDILYTWHADKIASLEHLAKIPQGVEVSFNSEESKPLVGAFHDGFVLGLNTAIIEMADLPFTTDESEPEHEPTIH